MITKEQNWNTKLQKLRDQLPARGYSALEINSQANFSWLTRGRGFIGLASATACGSIFITATEAILVTDNIEADRLYTEQLDKNPEITVRAFPWDKPEERAKIVADITAGEKLATEQDMSRELFHLRTVMTDYDLSDYRSLCKETAQILEETVKTLTAGISGYELAGEISNRFWTADIEPITILSAFDERALRYRHPLPAADKLQNYALVAICGRRNGLIVSATRNILLREDPLIIERHKKCAIVDAVATAKLKPGTVLGEIFDTMVSEYKTQGYPGEEKLHHQGGLTGFIPRELRANTGTPHVIREHEVYALNPSLQGAKCEDTILVTATVPEVMTHTGNYAYINCEVDGITFQKPTVWVLS